MVMENVEHLHPTTVPLLDLPKDERILKVRTKRWIPYTAVRQPYTAMQLLLDVPPQQRPENVLIEASTNNGKSMLLERFAADHPPCERPHAETAYVPVLKVDMPEQPTLAIVYQTILDRLFCPYTPTATRAQLRRSVFTLLKAVGTRIVLMDEVHNLAQAGPAERDGILAFFRALGNDEALRISLVYAGTPGARRIVQADPQLLNRFDVYPLPIWRDGEAFRELLASFEALLPLRHPSFLGDDDELAEAILRRSEGLIGEMFKIVSRSAVLAIETGEERISMKTLSKISYQSPAQRKVPVEDVLSL